MVCSTKTANPFSPDNARMYPVIFAPVNPESVIHLHEIPKISEYLKTSKLKSLYNNVPFIFECFHDGQHAQ